LQFTQPVATEFSVGGKIMWRKPEDSKPAAPAAEIPAPAAAPRVEPAVRSVAGLTAEVVQPSGGIITSTLLIKGEVRGSDDLYVDGEVQGTIHLTNGRVTVGPHGKISADVDAREIIVRGKVTGALRGRERVEIGSTGEVRGDIATSRIAIGEGAQIHSKVEIARAENSQNNRAVAKSTGGATASTQAAAMKAGGENGN
jgi:cytoskeletal protein CcmA (bactofilin family)